MISTFEIWCYRKILQISWVNQVINEDVLCRLQKRRNLLHPENDLKLTTFERIIPKYQTLQLSYMVKYREKEESVGKNLLWLCNIRAWSGFSAKEVFHFNLDRERHEEDILNTP